MQRDLRPRWPTLAQSIILPVVALVLSAAYWRTGPLLTLPTATPTDVAVAAIAEPSQPPTASATPSPAPSATPTATATPTPTHTPSPTPTPSPTAIATSTATPTATATQTPTSTPTPTPLLPTPDGVARQVRVPILMYHHIEDPPPGSSALRRDLSVTPQRFEEQLRYLADAGYETISLHDLVLHITIGEALPPRPIILTFDDGYRDAYENAFAILQRFDSAGTFFLVTAPLDGHNPDWLAWSQVEEMSAAGMHFEPHSYDHPDLRNRDFDFLVFQILAAKGAIEARTGTPCRFFAYPSGRYDSFVIDVLRSADFWGAVVTAQGATHTADDLFTLRRVRIQGDDSLADFVNKLNLDW